MSKLRKFGKLISKSFALLFLLICYLFKIIFKISIILLPSFVLFLFLSSNLIELPFDSGKPNIKIVDFKAPHNYLPRTSWSTLKPCSAYFDEQEEADRALQCVNKKVWPDKPLKPLAKDGYGESESVNRIPRCFIVPAESADVVSVSDEGVNVVLIQNIFGRIGAIVGVFDPVTQTIFIVENLESAKIYRHELQHLFIHLHDPENADGGGHDQEIWKKCEPPTYIEDPSIKIIVNFINNLKTQ